MIKKLKLNSKEASRFERLCRLFGFKVETDATYTYDNLCETAHYYFRVIKNNVVICIADIIE